MCVSRYLLDFTSALSVCLAEKGGADGVT